MNVWPLIGRLKDEGEESIRKIRKAVQVRQGNTKYGESLRRDDKEGGRERIC